MLHSQVSMTSDEEYILRRREDYPNDFRIQLPTSKSVHIRAMLLELVSGGLCYTSKEAQSDDVKLMSEVINELRDNQLSTPYIVDLQNAGAPMRFLTAYMSSLEGRECVVTGVSRMKERPISPLVDALMTIGADISYEEKEGYPPLRIKGRNLIGGRVYIDANMSSQYVTALMLLAPKLKEGIEIRWNRCPSSFKYISLTTSMLKDVGVDVEWIGEVGVRVKMNGQWANKEITCEADWSSATFWYALVAILDDVRVRLSNLHSKSVQPDVAIIEMFQLLGVATVEDEHGVVVEKRGKRSGCVDIDMQNNPDVVPAFVVACLASGMNFVCRNIHTLRVKECDRVAALVSELGKLGYLLKVSDDDKVISWDGKMKEATFDTISVFGDHRIAMALSLMTLKFNTLSIDAIDVVGKSYPQFWEHIKEFIIVNKKIL